MDSEDKALGEANFTAANAAGIVKLLSHVHFHGPNHALARMLMVNAKKPAYYYSYRYNSSSTTGKTYSEFSL